MLLQRKHAFCHKCLLRSSPSTPSSAAGLWRARKRQQSDGTQWGAETHSPPRGRIARGDFHLSRARGRGLIRRRDRQVKAINAAESRTCSNSTVCFIHISEGITCLFNCTHKTTCNHRNSPFRGRSAFNERRHDQMFTRYLPPLFNAREFRRTTH